MARLQLSQVGLADRLRVDTRTVRRLTLAGVLYNEPPESGRGNPTYPWPENGDRHDAWKVARLREEILAELGDPTDPAVRKLEAEARRAEIQLAELERSLVSIDDLEEVVADLLDRLQSVILNIPGAWSPHLVKLSSRRKVTVKLRPLMGELLDSLRTVADAFDDEKPET